MESIMAGSTTPPRNGAQILPSSSADCCENAANENTIIDRKMRIRITLIHPYLFFILDMKIL
jgi:hypothetical protein